LVRITAETGETPIKLPVRLSVEISFPKTKGGPLVLRARDTWSDDVVSDLELMDDGIYQQFAFNEWEIENVSRKAWNLADLRGAKIKVALKYLFFDPINLERPPRINDLHLCFGRGTVSTLYLQESQLAAQRWADDDEDRRTNDANEHAWMKTLAPAQSGRPARAAPKARPTRSRWSWKSRKICVFETGATGNA
jgi:hypothetical protein